MVAVLSLLFYQLSNQIFFCLVDQAGKASANIQATQTKGGAVVAQRYVLLAYEVKILTELHYQGVCR